MNRIVSENVLMTVWATSYTDCVCFKIFIIKSDQGHDHNDGTKQAFPFLEFRIVNDVR